MESLTVPAEKTLYVDIDQKYDAWTAKQWVGFRERCHVCEDLVGVRFKVLQVRRSPSRNIHARIVLRRAVSVGETFVIRAFLGDDPVRLACDINRFALYGTRAEINRIFCEKFVRGETRIAGPWIDLSLAERAAQVDLGSVTG